MEKNYNIFYTIHLLIQSKNKSDIILASTILETVDINRDNLIYLLTLFRISVCFIPSNISNSIPGFTPITARNHAISRDIYNKTKDYLTDHYDNSRTILEICASLHRDYRDTTKAHLSYTTCLSIVNSIMSNVDPQYISWKEPKIIEYAE